MLSKQEDVRVTLMLLQINKKVRNLLYRGEVNNELQMLSKKCDWLIPRDYANMIMNSKWWHIYDM